MLPWERSPGQRVHGCEAVCSPLPLEHSKQHATAIAASDRCPYAHHLAAKGAIGAFAAGLRFANEIIPSDCRCEPLVCIMQSCGELHTAGSSTPVCDICKRRGLPSAVRWM